MLRFLRILSVAVLPWAAAGNGLTDILNNAVGWWTDHLAKAGSFRKVAQRVLIIDSG